MDAADKCAAQVQILLQMEDFRRMRSELHSARTDDGSLHSRGLSLGVDLDSGDNVTDAEYLHRTQMITVRALI